MLTTPDDYVNQLYPEDEELQLVIEAIREHGMPEVSVAPAYGRLLTLLVQTAGARNILEIGALGGYSGICLCRGLPADGKLTSLELKEEYAALAGAHLEKAGFKDRVEYRIGPAADSLAALKREGRTFDFFFIDADKENYPLYLEYAMELANPGALIAGDNCFLRGRTLNSEKNGPSVQAVRRFNEIIATDERLVSTLLPAYDGLILARVK
ncbi:O-methyltransferase [Paenibacillus glucanolyticus]|uniref:O-methyltransferase n=1 Tax=Paenibacillus TaxID=44249 RepID=UPI0003E2A009|nr:MULTISPECIES: O-methyltransferase [Paenibacillus]ANA78702.1 methyltransferase [Paenibacillus glucanolyticus]AVV57384.1 O-methyltransferase [Paenibacillus glucanolyticus]ETT35291.1 O-methyltransferase family 3 [Paenibacillus sp. FSL R5-808]